MNILITNRDFKITFLLFLYLSVLQWGRNTTYRYTNYICTYLNFVDLIMCNNDMCINITISTVLRITQRSLDVALVT